MYDEKNLKLTIIPNSVTDNCVDIVQRIKDGFLGKLYSATIKKNNYTRNVSIFLWKTIYPQVLRLRHFLLAKTKKELTCLTALDSSIVKETRLLPVSNPVFTPKPVVYPAIKNSLVVSPHEQYDFPAISLYEIEAGQVTGGTHIIIKDNLAISHNLIDFTKDYTSEELHGRLYVNLKKKRAIFTHQDENAVQIECAATFIDACAPNYAHWMTEVLPKINLFCVQEEYKSVPIIINSDLHSNIMNSLSMVVDKHREVIVLPIRRSLSVNKLYVLSSVGYVPFDHRKKNVPLSSHGLFSPDVFQLLREKIHALLTDKQNKVYEKVYIRRNASIRNVLNTDEVESFFVAKGFRIVEPEKLSFIEQVSIFSHARIIVGATGAAFANLIFCQKNTRIIIFLPEIADTSFYYWQNMACATGNCVEYVLGKVDDKSSGIHSNYYISPVDLTGFD